MKKNEDDITVIRIDTYTIQCELHSKDRMVNLPKIMFPDDIKVGSPFTIFIDGDIKPNTLLIKKRILNKEASQKGNLEMLSLVESL